MVSFKTFLVIISLCALQQPVAYADTSKHPDHQQAPTVLLLQGSISRNMLKIVREALKEEQPNVFPAGVIILLDSPGGDGVAAMKIGDLLRKAKAHVFVTGQCASACVFVLASGVVRAATAYTVGLHRGQVTVSGPDGRVKNVLSPEEDNRARDFLRKFEIDAAEYFKRMGMAPELYETMQKFERRSVYRLNVKEMREFRLTGGKSSYLYSYLKALPEQADGLSLTQSEFMRKADRTPSRCGAFEHDLARFLDCYRTNLIDPY